MAVRHLRTDANTRQLALWLTAAMLLPTLAAWVYFSLLGGHPAARWMYLASKVVQFALPVLSLWSLRLVGPFCRKGPGDNSPLLPTSGLDRHPQNPSDHQNPSDSKVPSGRRDLPGLRPAARTLPSLIAGTLLGLVIAALGLGLYFGLLRNQPALSAAAAPIAQKLADFGVDSPATFLLLALFLSVVHAWLEEYYWRWFVFARLTDLVPVWLANLLSSLAFAAHHVIVLAAYFSENPLAITLGSLAVAIGGALWAILYRTYGSLAGPWISHLLVDAAIMAIGYDMAF